MINLQYAAKSLRKSILLNGNESAPARLPEPTAANSHAPAGSSARRMAETEADYNELRGIAHASSSSNAPSRR